MINEEQEDQRIYDVVVNIEEQYSIWPTDKDIPLGWREAGKQGKKEECLAYIEEVWTDMRPLSLRKQMEKVAQQAQDKPKQPELSTSSEPYRDPLVQFLSEGDHPLTISRHGNSVEKFQESIERGYVLIKFTDTKGETELGLPLSDESDVNQADFEKGLGTIHLEGDLTINFVKVRCIVDVDIKTMEGKGHLEVLSWPDDA